MSNSAVNGTGALYPVSIATVIVAAVVVAARLVTRFYIVKSAGWDDYLIVVALISSIGMSVTMVEQINAGLNTTHANPPLIFKAFWASTWVYNISNVATKSSIAVSYFRIFIDRRWRRACWALIILICLYGCWATLSAMFTCFPISKAWTTYNFYGNEYCQNRFMNWFFNASLNILLDLLLICLPMPVLTTLRMALRQKIALMFVFALGGFVCIISAVRLNFLVIMSRSTVKDNRGPATWSVVEVNLSIICASLPPLKALVMRLRPSILGFSSHIKTQLAGNATMRESCDLRHTFSASSRLESGASSQTTCLNGPDISKASHLGDFRSSVSNPSYEMGEALHDTKETGISITTRLEQEIEGLETKDEPISPGKKDAEEGLSRLDSGLDSSDEKGGV